MSKSYQALSTVTVGASGTASITFSSIPSTYTDLLIRFSSRTNNSDVTGEVNFYFNGTTSNRSSRWINGNGSTASSSSHASETFAGYGVGANATANTFSNIEIYIPNYAGSTYKTSNADGVGENNSTSANSTLATSLWSDTSAVTSVTLVSSNSSKLFQQ